MAYRHESRKNLLAGDPGYEPYVGPGAARPPFRTTTSATTLVAQSNSKMYLPQSKWGWAFLSTALVQTVIILAMEA